MDTKTTPSERNRVRSRHVVRAASGALLGFGSVVVGAALYATSLMNRRDMPQYWSEYTFSPYEINIPTYEEVSFKTDDGLTLRGWWLAQPESDRLVIAFAGHRSPKSDMLGIGAGLWRAGNNVLLFDWRSRGQSDVAQHSLAFYEVRDAEAAIRYGLERMPEAKLGVIGFSMGAATAILVAARTPDIRAVVADSPFTGVADVVAYGLRRRHLPAQIVVPVADTISGWRYGYRFGAVRPIDVVEQISPRPLLIYHGEADSLIPVEHAHRLFAAAGEPKQLIITPKADHCGSYFIDRRSYVQNVAAFFDESLG